MVVRKGPGALVGIVGPSGSGKDTLLRGANQHFATDRDVVFPTRAITRPEGDANEEHLALSPEAFEAARAGGAFALDWDAHGLRYGIPASIEKDIADGRTVVVNLSRGIIADVLARYGNATIASVEVAPDILRQRLIGRGRETEAEVEERLKRIALDTPMGPRIIAIDNSGSPTSAIKRFCAVIETARASRFSPA